MSTNNTKVKSEVNITISSEPNSICSLAAIDKSVSFMGSRNSVNFNRIFDSLNEFEAEYDYQNIYTTYDDVCGKQNHTLNKRSILPFPFPSFSAYDSTKAFRDTKLIYLSDLKIYYQNCYHFPVFYGKFF